ncbi:MAG: hypothetical protein DYG98_27470 [Haliscomenobacteraceae bacterium CHB4]|nr:hypothetical protein [Haliscomenobacteraceae bacterium CHB4]
MAKFLTTFDINAELANLIRQAGSEIILVSPYIKLHTGIRDILALKKNDPEISITVMFGKNGDNIPKSLGKEDFDFLKTFPNITIRYSERLHAKYYANESSAILTSMNLYDYSQNNNIEFGILLKTNFVKDIAVALAGDPSLDSQAYGYFQDEVIPKARIMFRRAPEFDKGIAGTGVGKKYIRSVEQINDLEMYYRNVTGDAKSLKSVSVPPERQSASSTPIQGYCIRTGKRIPFNPKRPLSDDAYKSWSQFSNSDYPEKYCHFSGEPSNGETTFARPILRKNWTRAKEVFEG